MDEIVEIDETYVPEVTRGLNERKEEKRENMGNRLRNIGYPKKSCVFSWEPIGSVAK